VRYSLPAEHLHAREQRRGDKREGGGGTPTFKILGRPSRGASDAGDRFSYRDAGDETARLFSPI